ncbi:MAG: 50S ribosomal protein L25 [Candidatus Staskawiczbacteria bacterium]|jgi:large subunit ribosomal protein L25
MISLKAKIRKETGKKVSALKESGRIPAVIYGHKIKNVLLDIDYKEFQKVLREAGESSLIELDIEGEKGKRPVLVHELQKDPVTDKFIHIDFFQASLTEEVEVKVPLVFEGTSLAVKDLGGTLVKNISELEVKALAQNLLHEIKVSIDGLNTFEDHILVKDLILPKDVKIIAKPDEIVVSVAQPAKVEEELAKEIEEKVEDIEKVEKEKKTEEVVEEEKPTAKPTEEKK